MTTILDHACTEIEKSVCILKNYFLKWQLSGQHIDDITSLIGQIENDINSISTLSSKPRDSKLPPYIVEYIIKTTYIVNRIKYHVSAHISKDNILDREIIEDNNAFIQHHELLQRDIDSDKDALLDNIATDIGSLKDIAITIGTTLDHHNEIIEDLTVQTDQTNSFVVRSKQILDDMIKHPQCSICIIIAVLIVIFVALAVVLIYI